MLRNRSEDSEQRLTQSVVAPRDRLNEGPALSEKVSVPQKVEKQAASTTTIPTIVVPFFLVIAMAIGAVFFFHYQHLQAQRALYTQYTMQNAWRRPFMKSYKAAAPFLDEFDSLALKEPKDWNQILADNKKFLSITAGMARRISSTNHIEIYMDNKWWVISRGYEDALQRAEMLHGLHTNPADRWEARRIVAQHIFMMQPGSAWMTASDEKAEMARIRKRVTALTDDQLEAQLKTIYLFRNPWEGLKGERKSFEGELQRSEEIPPGLDPEFLQNPK